MKIGIVGAGTMGSGIALSALYADFDVVLYDVYEAARDKAGAYIKRFLTKKDRLDALHNLTITGEMTALQDCRVVIEAVIEDLDVKRTLFEQLDSICADDTIFATNTSTISVTALASATAQPARVLGMHFFNPAPVMKLVEVIRADQTDESVIAQVTDLARTLGKTPVIVQDTPGFIVNRVARPFYLESLRIVNEGIATPEQVDTVLQFGAGFRMGPFQLMDLIGIDVSLASSQSVYEQTFYEPRFRPSLLQARMVQAKRLGRKTGHGFYDYNAGDVTLSPPPVPDDVGTPDDPAPEDAALHVPPQIGFDGTMLPGAQVVTMSATGDVDRQRAAAHLHTRGLGVVWLAKSTPGHVLSRVICQIINEAAFALGEGVADAETIDTALKLGVNYPSGPFEWLQEIGVARVITILDRLYAYYHEDRYRVAPALRQMM